MGVFVASLVLTVVLFSVMPQDFLPSDDTGRLQGAIQAANGTSYTQMATYTQQVAKIVGQDPDIEGVLAQMDGANGSAGTNQARMMMNALKPLGIRKTSPGGHHPAVASQSVPNSRGQRLPHQSALHPAGRPHVALHLPVHLAGCRSRPA